MKRFAQIFFAGLFLTVSIGSSAADDAAADTQIRQLSDRVDRLERGVEANNLDTRSKVHLAGYAAAGYTDQEQQDGRFNQVLFAPIFHYQYDDLMLLESELEIELTESGETEMALEYLTLDLLANDYVAIVAGKFLSPLGQFRQNLHPSWVNKLPSAPLGFGHDGAAPLSDVGVQLRGGFPHLGAVRGNYALYVANGPVLTEGHEPGEFVIESEGMPSDPDGRKVYGGRLGIIPVKGLEIGFSGAVGGVGMAQHDNTAELEAGEPKRDYSVLGADGAYQWRGLELRGEYIRQRVSADADSPEAPDEMTWAAWYAQAAYQLPATKWEGVVRYGDLDVPGTEGDKTQWAFGVNYVFASNVIAKLAYELNREETEHVDNDRVLVQLAYGF